MYASFVTVFSALAATAAALPHAGSIEARNKTLAVWPVTEFSEGCSPGGCISSFDIKAPAGYVAGAPAFNVQCHPIYIQKGWVECDAVGEQPANSYVESMWSEASERELIKISVAHIWTEGEARYNASGFVETKSGVASFELPVTQITGVL
ncbi:hypothetical protein F4779DRAFT_578577 [Xylariaceae sp. FL0662B]|nr:hypothetical protein F4779DRAFT_578577 [Xylariaceae sp. FL0662B]